MRAKTIRMSEMLIFKASAEPNRLFFSNSFFNKSLTKILLKPSEAKAVKIPTELIAKENIPLLSGPKYLTTKTPTIKLIPRRNIFSTNSHEVLKKYLNT